MKLTRKQLEAQSKRFEQALRWALGELGTFSERQDGEGPYFWRHELQKRAGLRWDHRRMRFVPREQFSATEKS